MRVLLTGATGFIGQEVGQRLVRQGHEIVALVRDPERAKQLLSFPAQIVRWQGGVETPPLKEISGIESVIHLAGENVAGARWTEPRKQALRESRISATRQLVNALKVAQAPLKSFVMASAMGIYGSRGDELLREDSEFGSDFLAQLCRDWESAAEPVKELGARLCIIRLPLVIGVQGGLLQRLLPIFQMGLGGPIGFGNQWMSWVTRADAARAFVEAVANPKFFGPFNLTAEPVLNREFTATLSKQIGRPAVFMVPKLALKVLFGELAQAMVSSQRLSAQRISEEAGFELLHPRLSSALSDSLKGVGTGELVLEAGQWIPQPLEKSFAFFASEKNLERITPDFLKFRVVGCSTEKIEKGSLIDYRLKVHGLPISWRTLIDEWEPNKQFVDTQLKGPYAKWHHRHGFESMANGTLLTDRVVYRLPFGAVGLAASGWFVQRDVEQIFNYRRKVIAEMFYPGDH